MKPRSLLVHVLFLAILVGPLRAFAEEPEVMAALSVMGYGYKVKLTINGVDTGIQGGKSESRRLFDKASEMAKKATPEIRARNFILHKGANEIVVEYTKVDPKGADALEITLEAEGYPEPVFKLTARKKVSDKVNAKVNLATKAPADFKSVIIAEPSSK